MRILARVHRVNAGEYVVRTPACYNCIRFYKAALKEKSATFRSFHRWVNPAFDYFHGKNCNRGDLTSRCDIGTKTNSKGIKESWVGFKLHLDAADGQIPVSCILTSDSTHDSQVALPLATITSQRVTNLYDLMDSACDAPIIREHNKSGTCIHHCYQHTPE